MDPGPVGARRHDRAVGELTRPVADITQGLLVEDLLEADHMRLQAIQLPRDPSRLLLVLGGRARLLVGVLALAFPGEVEHVARADLDVHVQHPHHGASASSAGGRHGDVTGRTGASSASPGQVRARAKLRPPSA